MNATLKLFLFGFLIAFYSQSGWSQPNVTNPNGYNKFYYGDGRISSEGMMRDGKPDGYWKTYYVNGKIKSEGNRKNFQLDSLWLFYDDQGNIQKSIEYDNDKRNGLYTVYKLMDDSAKSNIIISKELYLNDLKQGISYYYYDNGKLQYQTNFQDNRKHGEGLEYDQNGVVISEYVYRNDITISKVSINRYDRNGEKTGTWKTFHENGKTKEESYYKNGKLNGYVKEYDEKGKMISSKRYVDGEIYTEPEKVEEKVIVKKEYFDNGKVKTTGGFVNEKPVGQHIEYAKSGKIVETKRYNNSGVLLSTGIIDEQGLRQGDWTFYFLSGKVKSVGKYKNNRRQDEWVFYHENGQIEQKGEYDKRGKETGPWIWYFDNGNVLREEVFKDGLEDGVAIEYQRNGEIISKGTYVEGIKEGEWFYDVGDEIEQGNYKAGLKDGVWKHYYPDKTLKFEGRYVDGEEQGKHKYYYPDGKLKMEGEFSMGKRHNDWRFYDEDGLLRITITYQFDVEQKVDGKVIESKKG
jgi:antitoxin component YwqK of YwqJK toxin-antitoxin module